MTTPRKPKHYDYYQKLRRTSRKQYHSATTQAQMLADRQTLGQSFYSVSEDTKAKQALKNLLTDLLKEEN